MHLLSKNIVGISIKKSKTSYNLINLLKTEFANSEDEVNSTRTELFWELEDWGEGPSRFAVT